MASCCNFTPTRLAAEMGDVVSGIRADISAVVLLLIVAVAGPALAQPTGGAVAAGDRPVKLGLVCFGDGKKDSLANGSSWRWNSHKDRYEYDTYTETRPEVFDASLMVQLWEDGGRIRLPKSLIPPINSRGAGGWWDLNDVRMDSDTITATYRLNGLNKPKVMIDRRSGRITVQGFSEYAFRGSCDQLGATERKF